MADDPHAMARECLERQRRALLSSVESNEAMAREMSDNAAAYTAKSAVANEAIAALTASIEALTPAEGEE